MQTGGVFDELGLGAEELSFELLLVDSNHSKNLIGHLLLWISLDRVHLDLDIYPYMI